VQLLEMILLISNRHRLVCTGTWVVRPDGPVNHNPPASLAALFGASALGSTETAGLGLKVGLQKMN
jgi:hypothetical protein